MSPGRSFEADRSGAAGSAASALGAAVSSTLPTPADLQADALVAEIGEKVAQQQRELLAAAQREADQVRERARVKARRQLRRAVQEMRVTERLQTRQLRAELETATRREASRRALELLAAAWPRLAEALERRWSEPAARAHWLEAQVRLACTRLASQGWVVRHPADWGEAGIAALQEVLQAHGIDAASLQADASLPLGLVIEADGARHDSRPAALLSDRARVEAILLAALRSGDAKGAAR